MVFIYNAISLRVLCMRLSIRSLVLLLNTNCLLKITLRVLITFPIVRI
jgi:hypothetical protein